VGPLRGEESKLMGDVESGAFRKRLRRVKVKDEERRGEERGVVGRGVE
jgi:hypothetical protein